MVWYYAEGDRQKGPISDEEFQDLVNRGRIHRDTLIWKDGMDNWQALESAREVGLVNISPASPPVSGMPETPVPPPPGSGSNAHPASTESGYAAPSATPVAAAPGSSMAVDDASCAQCGRNPLGPYDGVQLGNLLLCRNCDADLARHYHQAGATTQQVNPWAESAGSAADNVLPGSISMPYASILVRAGAKLIDNLLETVVLLVLLAATTDLEVLIEAVQNAGQSPENLIIALRPFLLASLAFKILYETILVGKFGATLGKMALGIRVVASDGTAVRYNQAVIRAIAPAILQLPGLFMPETLIAFVAQFLFMFAYLIAVFDIQKRTLFDHAASTRVIKG